MADMLSLRQNQFLTQHTPKVKLSVIYKITGKIQYYVIPGCFIILNHFNKDQLICFTVQCLANSNLNARFLFWPKDYSV